MVSTLWQRILAWLVQYVWPNVQDMLVEKMLDLVKWLFDWVEEFYRERNQKQQDTARQKSEEADKMAEEMRPRAEAADRYAKEAEQRAQKLQDQADKHEGEVERLKAELEMYKAELEKCKIEAELDKQKAIATVWREVAEMLSREKTQQEQGLETIRDAALSHARETASDLKPEDVFPAEVHSLLPPPNTKDEEL